MRDRDRESEEVELNTMAVIYHFRIISLRAAVRRMAKGRENSSLKGRTRCIKQVTVAIIVILLL